MTSFSSSHEVNTPILRIGVFVLAVIALPAGVAGFVNGKPLIGLLMVGFGALCVWVAVRRASGDPSRIKLAEPDDDPELRAIREQMQRGEFAQAKAHFAGCSTTEDREYCLGALTKFDGRPACFDNWVAAEPGSGAAWLLRGAHSIRWAWEARTGSRAEDVPEEAWGIFHERLEMAWDSLEKASERDSRDPLPPAEMIRVSTGQSRDNEEVWELFHRAVALQPNCYYAHEAMLMYLCQKWMGSHEEMFEFARSATQSAPEGSNVPVLIPYAHIERWLFAASFDQEPGSGRYLNAPEVRAEIEAAYHKSLGSPAYRPSKLTHRLQNRFAFALAQAGSLDLARKLFEQIGDRPTEDPWQYLDTPERAYARMRQKIK